MEISTVNLLLIDQSPANAAALRFTLSTIKNGEKWNLVWFGALDDAWDYIKDEPISVILMGTTLPGGPLEALNSIKAKTTLPIIVFSSADDEAMAARLIQAGAQDFIVNGQFTGRGLVRSVRSAIERQRMLLALDQKTKEVQLLYEAGQSLSRTLDLDKLYETFLGILKQAMICDHLFISTFDPAKEMIYCVFAMTDDIILDSSQFPALKLEPEGKGLQSIVIRTGKPLLCNDWPAMLEKNIGHRYYVGDDNSILSDEELPEDEEVTKSGIIVPIIFQGQVVGAIQILTIQPDAYTENDLRIAEALAAQIAVASNNAILYQRARFEIDERKLAEDNIRNQVERLLAIGEINRLIGSSVELNENFPALLKQIRVNLHVDAVLILKHHPESQALFHGFSDGFRASAIEKLFIQGHEDTIKGVSLKERRHSVLNIKGNGVDLKQKEFWEAEKFVSFYSIPLVANGTFQGVLEVFTRESFDADFQWLDFFETLARQLSLAMNANSLFQNLKQSNQDLQQAYDATIQGWSNALDLRDKETEGHSQRVTELTIKMAEIFGFNQADLIYIRWGALLHDIGKMGIPDQVLLKPGPLSDEEWLLMKKHPVYGFSLLKPIQYLGPALDIPYCHHEKWDGTGYPRGIHGEQIPLAARIFSVVDVYDALSSFRPYRNPWPKEKIVAHIRGLAGLAFDPQVIEPFIQIIDG